MGAVTGATVVDEAVDEAAERAAAEAATDRAVRRWAPYLALLVAAVATSGSLFFSDVLGWTPCNLCWYQRILMYPIVLVLAVGLVARDAGVPRYGLALALPGIAISTYHYIYQKVDWFDAVHLCGAGVSCKGDYLGRGFLTVPGLAFMAFLLVIAALGAALRRGGAEPLGPGRPWAAVAVTLAAALPLMLGLMWLMPAVRLQWLN